MKKSKLKSVLSIFCLFLALPALSQNSHQNKSTTLIAPLVYIGAYGGYGNISGGYQDDGEVAQGRLTLGIRAIEYKPISFNVETSIQSGNQMRLTASPSVIADSGGLPIQSTLKPLVDLLITTKIQFSHNHPIFGILKGGIAYRQLQLNAISSSRDYLRKTNAELQIGLGFNLTPQAMLTAFYQGIYAGTNADVALDSTDSTTISRIPTQQSVFLGLEYSF